MSLHRYWIKFEQDSKNHVIGTLLGCGVTAHSYEDALEILQDNVFTGKALPPVLSMIEDVDVSNLDPNHVLPNIGNPLRRGIWFPLAYADKFW